MPTITSALPQPNVKIMILVTEDWFLLSHFRPIVRALVAAFADVVVVATSSGRLAEIEAMGARTIAFDFARASFAPLQQTEIMRRLLRLIHREQPTVVHAIALKPIALSGLAFAASRAGRIRPKFVMHLTGVGFAGTSSASGRTPLVYSMTLRLMAGLLRSPNAALLVENPDDAARVAGADWRAYGNVSLIGGAGVDPVAFPVRALPALLSPNSQPAILRPPVAGFLGRMIWTKGVDVLVAAHRQLNADGVALDLHLGGTPDAANPRAFLKTDLDTWAGTPGITAHGRVDHASAFWGATHIAVVPSRGGEGLPRTLLEAAATGRALIVTDVPGCRHFVRHGVEGLIVPPDDAPALAEALRRLATDPALTQRLGENARARLLDGFTERHVAEALIAAYHRLLQP